MRLKNDIEQVLSPNQEIRLIYTFGKSKNETCNETATNITYPEIFHIVKVK